MTIISNDSTKQEIWTTLQCGLNDAFDERQSK